MFGNKHFLSETTIFLQRCFKSVSFANRRVFNNLDSRFPQSIQVGGVLRQTPLGRDQYQFCYQLVNKFIFLKINLLMKRFPDIREL